MVDLNAQVYYIDLIDLINKGNKNKNIYEEPHMVPKVLKQSLELD